MRPLSRSAAALILGLCPLGHAPLRAQDASFGCKVLLCAAASAPAWSGIPYCVPVMEDLFHQLAHGGSWPGCSAGDASPIGYDPYLPCPDGTVPMQATSIQGSGSTQGAGLIQGSLPTLSPSSNGNLCADPSKPQVLCTGGLDGSSCETTYPTTPRDARAEPYYVDLSTANGTERFYFTLSGS